MFDNALEECKVNSIYNQWQYIFKYFSGEEIICMTTAKMKNN